MICVDASVAAKWIFPEEYSQQALALFAAAARAGERLTAPPVFPVEVTNAIRQRMLRDRLTLDEAHGLLRRFSTFQVSILSPDRLLEEALALAHGHALPAVYDAYYLALAQRLGCDLWTNDQRLLRALGGKLPFVKWIGDYSP